MSKARILFQTPLVVILLAATWPLLAAPPTTRMELEVTQGMQYVDHPVHGTNSIPLVAGRTAVVRARVDIANAPSGKEVADITSQLKVAPAPGTSATATTPTASAAKNSGEFKSNLNKMLAGEATYERRFAHHTLNFQVEDLVEGKWEFKVELECKFENGVIAKGEGKATLDTKAVRPLAIRLVPLRFVDDYGLVYGPPDPTDHADSEWMVRACYPLSNDVDIRWEDPVDLPTTDRSYIGTIDGKQGADGTCDVDEVLDDLETMWESTVEAGDATKDLFYYGLVAPGPVDHTLITDEANKMVYGWGSCPVGFGTALPNMVEKVFLHEMGHSFALDHCGDCGPDPCGVEDQVGWDVYDGPGPSARANCMSFMTCGEPDKGVWVTPVNFKNCIELLEEGKPAGLSGGGLHSDSPTKRALVVHGALTPNGKQIAWLGPVFRYPWRLPPRPAVSKGPYEIRAASADGSVVASRRFEGLIRVEYKDGTVKSRPGYFSVVLPFPADVEVETVTIRTGNTILRTVTRPAERPEIQIATPLRNAVIDKPTLIRWTVKTAVKNLRFQLLYSPDGGESFRPVAVNLTELQRVFDPGRLSKTSNGLLRVIVSDGLNTVYQDVELLKVSP